MKTYEDIIKQFTERGYSVNIKIESTGNMIAHICHDSWWTSNMYQAVALPEFTGKNLDEVFVGLDNYLNSRGQ